MGAKEILTGLNEEQAAEMLKMAELGYKLTKENMTETGKSKSAYNTLMNMVGCTEAKETIRRVLASVRMSKIVRARGRQSSVSHYHMAFLGAPGTCKTTTARLYAEILCEAGITRSGRLVELSKASIVGKYQGHTPKLVDKAFADNKGCCILIDEAYSLNDTDSANTSTYGAEALNEIILHLEKETDTVVIFAGYTEKMQDFLDANPGLRSRVPITVSFPDYTTAELLAICKRLARERGYGISRNAEEKISDILDAAKTRENFGNGRYCRNLVEKAIGEKSLRLGLMDENFDFAKFTNPKIIPDEKLFTLDAACFNFSEEKKQKTCIGF